MDYSFELVKKYARVLTGKVTSPVVLNILITSVCDMRWKASGPDHRRRRAVYAQRPSGRSPRILRE
jgi:hypothetical protein